MVVVRPMRTVGREASRGLAKGLDRDVISLRRMTLGSGYRYLMESVAVGDGAVGASSDLTRYDAESGTVYGTPRAGEATSVFARVACARSTSVAVR